MKNTVHISSFFSHQKTTTARGTRKFHFETGEKQTGNSLACYRKSFTMDMIDFLDPNNKNRYLPYPTPCSSPKKKVQFWVHFGYFILEHTEKEYLKNVFGIQRSNLMTQIYPQICDKRTFQPPFQANIVIFSGLSLKNWAQKGETTISYCSFA